MSGHQMNESAGLAQHINIDPNLVVKIKSAASQDSEDSARISGAVELMGGGGAPNNISQDDNDDDDDDDNDGQQQQKRQDRNTRKQKSLVNGHHDLKQRKIYLSLLAFSIMNAVLGLALILVWMLQFRPVAGFGVSDKGQLSNLHVLLMYTFMVSLNMYAVLVYRTHFARPKQQLKWVHALMTGLNMLMALLGVAAMYKAHLMGNLANFYSLHSWIGALTNGFYVGQFAFGFVAFLRPQLSIERRQQAMPWHRLLGTAIVLLAGLAAITGIAELVIFQDREGTYQSFAPITFIANFAGVSVILMTASTVYLLTASQYRRAPLLEELPIKR